jgi:hypothetical protein
VNHGHSKRNPARGRRGRVFEGVSVRADGFSSNRIPAENQPPSDAAIWAGYRLCLDDVVEYLRVAALELNRSANDFELGSEDEAVAASDSPLPSSKPRVA